MTKHELKLLGGSGVLRVPAEILLETVGALLEGARQATRFMVEGESTRKGPRPTWLDAVCRLEITGLTAGSAVVAIEAPTLEEAVPERFGGNQPASIFYDAGPELAKRTAIEVFAGVLSSAIGEHAEQVLADRPLLDTCVRFVRAAGSAFDGIQLGRLAGPEPRLTVRREDARRIELLRDETPAPHAVRVTGILDTISATRSDIVLALLSGEKITARVEDHDPAKLKSLFGARVVLSGVARFRPTGRVLVVDVEHISEARAADALFETLPVASQSLGVAPSVTQDDGSGVSTFFGSWPGEETEEELLTALEAVG
jgi:hypothetical protein